MVFTNSSLKNMSSELNKIIGNYTAWKNDESPKANAVIAAVTTDKETVYYKSSGVRSVETKEPVEDDDVLSMFSCTKSITALGLLKLYEDGLIDIDRPLKEYLPSIGEIGVIEQGSVQKDGTFTTPPRKPENDITAKHLLTHTSGIAYAFMNKDYHALHRRDKETNAINPTYDFLVKDKHPLLFEPGTRWMYGHSMDWLGLVIEEITGKKLGEYLKEVLFDPAGMTSFTFHVKELSNVVKLHYRLHKKKKLIELDGAINYDPAIDMGGQGSFGSVKDYMKFIRIWLSKGLSPDTGKRILKEETVEFAIQNHLPPGVRLVFDFPGAPQLPPSFEPDGFTLTGNAYGMNRLPTGRPKGAIYWAGLANLYYWIDVENKIGGFWGSQLLPIGSSFFKSFQLEFQVYEAFYASRRANREQVKSQNKF